MSFLICRICKSEYRDEIEKLGKRNIPFKDITKAYLRYFEGVSEIAFFNSVKRHLKGKHPPLIENMDITPNRDKQSEESIKPATPEAYAQALLEIGMSPEMLTHKRIKHGDVVKAQNLLIEKQKAENQKNALSLIMSKLLSGLIKKEDIMEGEVIKDESPVGAIAANS